MSNINPQNIDGTYPIAGQDNNSQGFRDNFTNTVNNFTFAAAELTDLQTYALLKGPLGSVGQSGTPTNTMNYTYITQPQLLQAVETKYDFGTISTGGSFSVDWTQGHFQTVAISGTATQSFASTWPTTSLYTKLRLQVTTANTTVLTLASTITNVSSIQGWTSGQSVSLTAGVYVFEFTTYDAGGTVLMTDMLRNHNGNISVSTATFTSLTTTTLSATGTTTLSGNLNTGATHVETGYQQSKPTANVAVTVNANVNRVLLHPTGTIVSFGANVTLPNVQVDGTIINISSNVTIAALDVRPNWNGVVVVSPSGNATVAAGSNTRYLYIAADKVWYKIA
jgi:hypothetical protein